MYGQRSPIPDPDYPARTDVTGAPGARTIVEVSHWDHGDGDGAVETAYLHVSKSLSAVRIDQHRASEPGEHIDVTFGGTLGQKDRAVLFLTPAQFDALLVAARKLRRRRRARKA